MVPIQIDHFSDVLCVWAYFSEPRLAEVAKNFGNKVEITHRFVPVFGDVPGKMATTWASKGGYQAFADHLHHSSEQFPESQLNDQIWRNVRPTSSLGPHLYLKAIELCENDAHCLAGAFTSAIKKMRAAFFIEGFDIARLEVQQLVGENAGAPIGAVLAYLNDGRAAAALSADYKAAETLGISGSPTLVLNQGRQKLYGNVGYRIIEANILELLRNPKPEDASWC